MVGSRAIAAAVVLALGCQAANSTADLALCATRPLVDTGSDAPRWFALDDKNAYWGGTNALRAAPLCDGEARTLAQGVSPGALVAAGNTVYFASSVFPGSISAVPIDGGEVLPLVAQRGFVNDLVVDADYVYFLDGDALRRVPRSGGAAVDLVAGLVNPVGLVLSGSQLHWVNRGSEFVTGAVVEMSVAGTVPEVVSPGDAYVGGPVGALTVNGPTLYFGGWVGELYRIDGAGSPQLLLRDQSATALAVDNQSLYWVNQPSSPQPGLSSLARAGAGASATQLDARAVGNVLAFARDGLYYLLPEGIRRR